ncbi:hypothetical protein [Chamaesiphon minutus]|uniref:Uncharacterized protein n=1 Tax=Chamaesiphon minutus (strain ATCC 27169 / PCC 6605) TaxID=1173020 RepID=K9UD27_CHAP6|nr:hypothetical protein [Chamaesiphon minutus]AFY92558.1 hypothetical protein Cha6605_1379 [Chamaesiphon minutus PCC 6605]
MVKINSIEDIFYREGDIIPPPPRTYTEEEEAQNIEDEKLMAEVDMEGWAYERSHRHEDYDNLGDMLADGIDIDDIPETYYTYTKGNSKPREPLRFPARFIQTVPDVEEDIIEF